MSIQTLKILIRCPRFVTRISVAAHPKRQKQKRRLGCGTLIVADSKLKAEF
jgi:hypothetical protein